MIATSSMPMKSLGCAFVSFTYNMYYWKLGMVLKVRKVLILSCGRPITSFVGVEVVNWLLVGR
jgi:hypothetical protein